MRGLLVALFTNANYQTLSLLKLLNTVRVQFAVCFFFDKSARTVRPLQAHNTRFVYEIFFLVYTLK